eukprot:2636382-Rhodomonas_salina.2
MRRSASEMRPLVPNRQCPCTTITLWRLMRKLSKPRAGSTYRAPRSRRVARHGCHRTLRQDQTRRRKLLSQTGPRSAIAR